MQGRCRKCGEPIFDHEPPIFAIQGYERGRQQGGQNHVLRKKRIPGWVWHERCWEEVMREQDGSGEQLSLEATP